MTATLERRESVSVWGVSALGSLQLRTVYTLVGLVLL